MSKSRKVAIGAGIAAVGAGAYYLLGPNKKAHQKKVADLLAKIKKEVQSEIKKGKLVTASLYHDAVDTIAENYGKQYTMHKNEIKALAKKLKGEWKSIAKAADKKIRKSVRRIKKKI